MIKTMKQKLILVNGNTYTHEVSSLINDGWRIAQISAPGVAHTIASCWVLLEKE